MIATILRFVIAVGGAAVGVLLFDGSLTMLFAFAASGMFVYGVVTAASVWLGAWRR